MTMAQPKPKAKAKTTPIPNPNIIKSQSQLISEESKWSSSELLLLNNWIYCICLVDFDLTEGQITKFSYPFDILSEEEKTNIANLSFPDSHTSSNCCVNAKFCFRFRARLPSKSFINKLSQKTILSYNHRHKSHPYLFGYVYFRQKPDKSIDRGYFQKAIVIITPIPYIHVFIAATEIIGSLYFEYTDGVKILDTACRNICTWPLPSHNGDVTLPLLGNVIRVLLSPKGVPPSASILVSRSHIKNKKIIASSNATDIKNGTIGAQLVDRHSLHPSGGCFQEINIYRYFHVVLGNLWCLWELALTGQPLLVIGSSAEECSHAVLGIMSLISPITYHGDFRPYFTIYDDDFKHFCNLHDRDMLPPLILGVTNPFFLKVMPKYPHILVLSSTNTSSSSTNTPSTSSVVVSSTPSNDNDNDQDIKSNDQDVKEYILVNNNNNDKSNNSNNKKNKKSVMTVHVTRTQSDTHKSSVHSNKPTVPWGQQKEVDITKSHNTIISKSTPCLVPDEQVLSRLLTVSKATTSDGVTLQTNELEITQVCTLNNAILRKYFQNLTDKFLEPFQEYFTFKVPSGIWNPYLNPPSLKLFEKESFLNMIRDIPRSFMNDIPLRVSTLPTGKRSVLVKLYNKFLKSPHFPSWFNKKRERAKRKCDKIIFKMIKKIKFERLVEGRPVREGIKMYQSIHRHMTNNNQSNKPKADLNDILIRHRAVLRSALPSQIIEALDQQVEKMRIDQIKKRKEWQIKYKKHLKTQRARYNLDNNDNDNDNNNEIIDNDNDNDDQSIISANAPSDLSSNISSTPSISNKHKLSNSGRSRSYDKIKHKKYSKKKKKHKPNQMLTTPTVNNNQSNKPTPSKSSTSSSPILPNQIHRSLNDVASSSSPEYNQKKNKWITNSLHSVSRDLSSSYKNNNNNNDDPSQSKLKSDVNNVKINPTKVKKNKTFIFTSALSMGATLSLGGSLGVAPHQYIDYHSNNRKSIYKYHRYNNKSDELIKRMFQIRNKNIKSLSPPTPNIQYRLQHRLLQQKQRKKRRKSTGTTADADADAGQDTTQYNKYRKKKLNHNIAGSGSGSTILYDLNKTNDEINANDAISVNTKSFKTKQINNFKVYDDHF